MSYNAIAKTEVVSEICLDEIKEARGLLAKGKVQECQALLEDIEDMMFLILVKSKKVSNKLH